MCHLYKMRQLPGFRALQEHYLEIRHFAFVLVIMLNMLLLVNVDGPGNSGPPYELSAMFIREGNNAKVAVRALQGVTIFLYTLCLVHQIISRVALIWQKTKRDLDLEAMASGSNSGAKRLRLAPALTILVPWYAALAFAYGSMGLILSTSSIPDQDWGPFNAQHYYEWAVIFSIIMLPFALPQVFVGNSDRPSLVFDTFFKFVVETETIANLMCLSCLAVGYFRFYFLAFPLLDIVTLSPRLVNVIKSVTLNLTDLALVFTLMIFVAYIFSVIGLFMFGQQYVVLGDEFDFTGELTGAQRWAVNGTIAPNEETATCFNLLSCFTQTLDAGLRTGDIVDSSMDNTFFQDGQSHIDRVIFGLAFFLVLGVILFDIVTGIVRR